MDLLDIIRNDIGALPEGAHGPGLAGVLRQIETGLAHLDRGRTAPDSTAFTDTVYRCNQAFEGAIKEAYRVLAGRDPGREPLVRMEDYLEREAVLRPRVMAQFRTYRQEWRNPSTHDHLLEFDEAEAFLALVSIAAFAKLLVDRVAERLARDAARPLGSAEDGFGMAGAPPGPLVERVAEVLARIADLPDSIDLGMPAQRIGAAAGLLEAAGLGVETGDGGGAPDLLVSQGRERLAVNLAALADDRPDRVAAARARMEAGLAAQGAAQGADSGLLVLVQPGTRGYALAPPVGGAAGGTPERVPVLEPD
ncbi:MAG: hypothetical protein ACK4TG_10090 [Thermaurantiacus sp.]